MAGMQSRKALNIALWVAAALIAFAYASLGAIKLTLPIAQLATFLYWVPTMHVWFIRTLGLVEILAAIGLILPALTRIVPQLTVATALCVVVHQIIAMSLHLSRGEANLIGLNIVLVTLAIFLFLGRRTWSVITPRP